MKKKRNPKQVWLWENMKGYRTLNVASHVSTVVYSVMQLVVTYVFRSIIAPFL